MNLRQPYVFVFVAVIALCLLNCKHTESSGFNSDTTAHAWERGQKITTPSKVTYAFSWTNDVPGVENIVQFIEDKLSRARSRNAAGRSVDYRTAKAGSGIYAAADPFVSKSFGRYLLVLPFRPNQTLVALNGSIDDARYLEIVQSNAAGVVYPWNAWMADDKGRSVGYAAVLRDSALLDLTRLQVIGPIESDFRCKDLKPAPTLQGSWSKALQEVTPDFFGCTLPVIHDYAEYFFSTSAETAVASRHQDVPLLFAANIRDGNFLVEAAGVQADAVKCGTTPYCSLAFARSISHVIQQRWQMPLDDSVAAEPELGLKELIQVARDYRLLKPEQHPSSLVELCRALSERLSSLQPKFNEILRSHIVFYNAFMKELAPESMLMWQ